MAPSRKSRGTVKSFRFGTILPLGRAAVRADCRLPMPPNRVAYPTRGSQALDFHLPAAARSSSLPPTLPIRYVEPLYRRPIEADSLVLPVTAKARLLAQVRPAIEVAEAAALRPAWMRGL